MMYLRSPNDYRRGHNQFNNVQHSPSCRNNSSERIISIRPLPMHHWPGVLISTPKGILIDHYGIVTDTWKDGFPMVISNSGKHGKVVKETWWEFTGGQPVTIQGDPRPHHRSLVVSRAHQLLGTPYDLLSFNCEHFVRRVYWLPEESPQLQKAVLWTALTGVILYAIASDN